MMCKKRRGSDWASPFPSQLTSIPSCLEIRPPSARLRAFEVFVSSPRVLYFTTELSVTPPLPLHFGETRERPCEVRPRSPNLSHRAEVFRKATEGAEQVKS